jgi:hypothetical protein
LIEENAIKKLAHLAMYVVYLATRLQLAKRINQFQVHDDERGG